MIDSSKIEKVKSGLEAHIRQNGHCVFKTSGCPYVDDCRDGNGNKLMEDVYEIIDEISKNVKGIMVSINNDLGRMIYVLDAISRRFPEIKFKASAVSYFMKCLNISKQDDGYNIITLNSSDNYSVRYITVPSYSRDFINDLEELNIEYEILKEDESEDE